MNKPNRYVKRDIITKDMTLDEIVSYYSDRDFIYKNIKEFQYDIEKIKNMLPTMAIKYIRSNIGYDKYLFEYCQNKNIDYNEVLDRLDELEDLSIRYKTNGEFIKFINDYNEMLKTTKSDNQDNAESVKLMTFHGSKGLEFKYVIIIDANDGLIPHKKSFNDIETERRLFYVALTRAKEKLDILFTINRNGKTYKPSRFIIEGLKGEKCYER